MRIRLRRAVPTVCAYLLMLSCIPTVPLSRIGITLDDGSITVLLALCEGERVRSLELVPAEGLDPVWRVAARAHPRSLRSVTVGEPPSGYAETVPYSHTRQELVATLRTAESLVEGPFFRYEELESDKVVAASVIARESLFERDPRDTGCL